MEKIAVERSIWIDASLERAWQAVTEPAQLNQWYAIYYHWDIPSLQVGTAIRFYNKDDETDAQVATITVVNSPKEFTVQWEPNEEYPEVNLITSFLLSAENEGTRVRILETGYEAVPADARQGWLDATGGGYTLSLENLKAYLEGKEPPHK